MISKAFQLGRRVKAVRLVVCAAIMLSLVAPAATPVFAAGGQAGNLSGTVIDTASHAPIAGAKVSAVSPSGSGSAVTNGSGFFSILGLNVDTYTLSVEAQGYDSVSQSGITLTGDQTISLGNIALPKTLKTIVRTTSRPLSSAFQPTQTIDSYTVAGARITETTGKAATTNENSLLLSVPGVTLTNSGTPSIRGGGSREVGYQYDGVTFAEPFLGNNGSNGLFSGIGNVQVVEGAGDATQGNVGSGVVNIVPKRGTYPGFGYVDFEAGGPNFLHQFAFEYGIASQNGAISNYIAYTGQRFDPYQGYHNQAASPSVNYFAPSYDTTDQFTDNFTFKFGKNHSQSLQALYTNIQQNFYGNYGGIPNGVFNDGTSPGPTNLVPNVYYPYDTLTQAGWESFGLTPTQYANLIGLGPGVPAANIPISAVGPTVNQAGQTRFLKFEYDNNLSENTYLALRYYNWEQLITTDDQNALGPSSGEAFSISAQSTVGGPTTGASLDLTHQIGSKLTVNFNAKYDILHPQFDAYEPQLEVLSLGGLGSPSSASIADFLPGGYLSNFFGANIPRMPVWGIGYNGTVFDNYGTGVRFQYAPVDKLKLDLGVRYEGQDQHWQNQLTPLGQGPPASVNPFDVLSSSWNPNVLTPTEWEPRAAINFQMDPNDSLRFSYGRSAVFQNAQSAGTPFHLYGLGPFLNIPAVPGAMCGNPSTVMFACKTYAQQLYWQGDDVEFPDAGNGRPSLYTNYDFSIAHQFQNGFGVRLTPFYREGTDLPAAFVIETLPGGSAIFGIGNAGFNKTTGLELNLTTPEHRYGFSGFASATYQNVLSTTPPFTSNETNVPLVSTSTLELGDLYRAGYLSPASFRIGGTYNTRSGFSVTPVLQYNIGYPYTAGNLIAATLPNGQNANIPNVNFGPSQASPLCCFGIQNVQGTNLTPNYYDPANPGTSTNPNIAATRGTLATSANGGFLSPANLQANLTFQYKVAGNTFGVQIANVFGNAFVNSVPAINPFYQPVGNGLSGPQTGKNICQTALGGPFPLGVRGCQNLSNGSYAFTNGAYVLSNGDFTAATVPAPLSPTTFQVYYQRQL